MIALRLLRRACYALLAIAALYLVAALILGYIPVNREFRPVAGGTEIFVCSNGVHTDFVLPVKTAAVDWWSIFPPQYFPAPVQGFDHIGIGWGDLGFYRTTPYWRDFRIGTALHALAGLGPAALHVQYRPAPGAAERCDRLQVSIGQYRALVTYIVGALVLPQSPPPAAAGYGVTDLFFPAQGRFSIVKSCNVWVGEGLEAAGLPTGVWTPFSFLVLHHLEAHASP